MKTLVRFVLLLAVLLLGIADQGISQAFTCTIQNQSVNAGVFSFDVYIVRTGTALYLGTSDFVLTFNNGFFTAPVANITQQGVPGGRIETYYTAEVSIVSSNRLVVNLLGPSPGNQTQFDARVLVVSNTPPGDLVASVSVSGITNLAGTMGLTWRSASPNNTVIQNYQATTPWNLLDVTSNGTYTNPSNHQLPIQLVSFSVNILSTDGVELLWSTASEINNYGFYVQRSADAKTFATLPGSFQPGHGTTIEHHDYSYTDATAGDVKYFYRLEQVDRDGTITYSEPKEAGGTTGVKEQKPTEFALQQNYPNPFNPTSVIEYSLPSTSHVLLELYNLLGQKIETLVNDVKAPGFYQVEVNGAHLASGVYIYRLTAGQKTFVRKMALVK
jgi:hypothetical protein